MRKPRESPPAQERGLHAVALASKGLDREAYDRQLIDELRTSRVDLVCLAGYMRILSGHFIREFHQRILNIHPSLLPAFPGLDAQHQALEHGVKFSGCTVHFVEEGLDSGPIISQAVVPVLEDDTAESLSARILQEEHRIYPEAIGLVLSGRYRIEGRRVIPIRRGGVGLGLVTFVLRKERAACWVFYGENWRFGQ